MTLYTPADIAEARLDLAFLLAEHDAEADPKVRDMLADWIEIHEQELTIMIDGTWPALDLWLPIGLPAPRAIWGVGR